MSICNSGHPDSLNYGCSHIFSFFFNKTKRFMEAGLVNYRRKHIVMCVCVFCPSLSPQYSEEQGAVSSDWTEGAPGSSDL